MLTTLGLGFALLGIVLIAPRVRAAGWAASRWSTLSRSTRATRSALAALVLLVGGLAAKIGWAPVHNWLPDAHRRRHRPSRRSSPRAFLPAVLVVAWRADQPSSPPSATWRRDCSSLRAPSLAVAVPFLWRALAWKRLLAYSSLEHMGVLALGFGVREPARDGRRRRPRRRPRDRQGAGLLRGHAAAHPGSVRWRSRRNRDRAYGAVARSVHGNLAGDPRRAAAVAALRRARSSSWREGSPPAGRGKPPAPRSSSPSASSGSGTHCSRRSPGRRDAANSALPLGLRPVVVLTAIGTVALLTLTLVAPWLPGSELVDAMLDIA